MNDESRFSKVITLFHEAAVLPEFWPKALDALAEATGTAGALLWRPPIITIHSRGLSDCVKQLAEEGWAWADTPVPRHRNLAENGNLAIWTSRDIYTDEEFARDPYQQDFARRLGIASNISGVVARSSDGPTIFYASRRVPNEPFTNKELHKFALNLLPGLRSAGTLAARFGFAQSVAAASTLEVMNIAAVFVDEAGQVIEVTTAAEPILNELGNTLLLTCCSQNPRPHVHTQPNTGRRVVVRRVPVVGAANDLFRPATSILLLTSLDAHLGSATLSEDLLRQVFPRLTRAEAKFAALLATGMALDAIGSATNLTRESARFRLKRIFRATGTHRQGELVALLARLSRPQV